MNNVGFKEVCEKHFFKRYIQSVMGHVVGIKQYTVQIDTLYYFLNKYLDITKIPPAEGNIRDLQICDMLLLRLFDVICKSSNLVYWIDGGTLLGAKRHDGFIPWDDDIDVVMPRTDFNKAIYICQDILAKYNIEVRTFDDQQLTYFGIGYCHADTGIWLDVFPADEIYTYDSEEVFRKKIVDAAKKYNRYYRLNKSSKSKKQITGVKDEMFKNFKEGTKKYYWLAPEFNYPLMKMIKDEVIIPPNKILFEGNEFYSPNQPDPYLFITYGKDYMAFPRSGVEHHGTISDRLSDRAKKKNIELKNLQPKLQSIISQLSKEVLK